MHLLGELIRGREIFGWPTWGMLIETIDKVDWIVSLCRNLLHRRSNLKQCKSCFYQREKGVHIKSSHEILLLKKSLNKRFQNIAENDNFFIADFRVFFFFFFCIHSYRNKWNFGCINEIEEKYYEDLEKRTYTDETSSYNYYNDSFATLLKQSHVNRSFIWKIDSRSSSERTNVQCHQELKKRSRDVLSRSTILTTTLLILL